MAFNNNYHNLVSESTEAHTRLIRDYDGSNNDFDFIVIGSGIGGGILADDLADSVGDQKRILVLDAGSFVYPTHVYNISRYPNGDVAKRFGVVNLRRNGIDHPTNYIGEEPQMALGGRSIFWSGLIPEPQPWETAYFPDGVRQELEGTYLKQSGEVMNSSRTLGKFAEEAVALFNRSSLQHDFIIKQTPRAVHQPYLYPDGMPRDQFFLDPTGVFNTAELLINQTGLNSDELDMNGNGLFIKLNAYVEAVKDIPHGWHEVVVTDTVNGGQRSFYSPKVIIAAGSTESPKLINRSDVYGRMDDHVKQQVGVGLTDHPVSGEAQILTNRVLRKENGSEVESLDIEPTDHAKIIFYSRGELDGNGAVKYPFNIEMNINHEYWHLRENDPTSSIPVLPGGSDTVRVDIKFSFPNLLDGKNGVRSRPDDGYVPFVDFMKWTSDHIRNDRVPRIAGWRREHEDFVRYLREVKDRVFEHFDIETYIRDPFFPDSNWGFGWGTVHHACGTLRMPWKEHRDQQDWNFDDAVVDTNLQVKNSPGLYVCDMSVMPISTAANPVRTLGGLALRLSKHLQNS